MDHLAAFIFSNSLLHIFNSKIALSSNRKLNMLTRIHAMNRSPKVLAAVMALTTTTTLVTCWCDSSSPFSSHPCNKSSSSSSTSPYAPSQPHQTLSFSSNSPTVLVMGDVHGCYDEMMHLYETARQQQQHNNQKDFDAVICVGDLVNKGPKSYAALQHVRTQPHWYTVRGNHEEGALKYVHKQRIKNQHQPDDNTNSKYAWTSELTADDMDYMKELPYTIWLESFQTMIVHSGLMPGVPLEEQSPNDMITMRNIDNEPWARVWNEHPSSSYKVIFGHDAKRGLQTYPKALGLDTGCCYGKVLTGVILPQGTIVQVPARQVYCPIRSEER